jgi:hypothetical protein
MDQKVTVPMMMISRSSKMIRTSQRILTFMEGKQNNNTFHFLRFLQTLVEPKVANVKRHDEQKVEVQDKPSNDDGTNSSCYCSATAKISNAGDNLPCLM